MVIRLYSGGLEGVDAFPVEVEVDYVRQGLPGFSLVGLAETEVREARDRVFAALRACNFRLPPARITVNLAPAGRRKAGTGYDLPLAVGLLAAAGLIPVDRVRGLFFIGELSLTGALKPVRGVLPLAILARRREAAGLVAPPDNAAEAAVVRGLQVYAPRDLAQCAAFLAGAEALEARQPGAPPAQPSFPMPDFAEVKGQQAAKRALEVAAAGGHNLLLIGPPGSGKTMLAQRLPTILPPLSFEEALEVTKIYSVAGHLQPDAGLVAARPFRSPHHTVSPAGLSGGGTVPRPGEISLAHNGVLFLDELPEFSRTSMEVFRQPIEDGKITIARVAATFSYPCSVMLVCAMNPCPCGYFGHPTRKCTCPKGAPQKYLSRVSGPLLDRLDIHIEVPPVDFDALSQKEGSEECSSEIKARVNKAREIQRRRFKGTSVTCNAKMDSALTRKYCIMTTAAANILRLSFDKLGLSARAYDKVLRVARTIADLDGSDVIDTKHIAEAVQYRSLDRKFWKE